MIEHCWFVCWRVEFDWQSWCFWRFPNLRLFWFWGLSSYLIFQGTKAFISSKFLSIFLWMCTKCSPRVMECSLSIKQQKHEVRGTFGRELVGYTEEEGGTEDKRVCEWWFISPGIYGWVFFSDSLCFWPWITTALRQRAQISKHRATCHKIKVYAAKKTVNVKCYVSVWRTLFS